MSVRYLSLFPFSNEFLRVGSTCFLPKEEKQVAELWGLRAG